MAASNRTLSHQLVTSAMGVYHIQSYCVEKKFPWAVSHICHSMGSGGKLRKECQDWLAVSAMGT